MTKSRAFHLGDVLSVMTGLLVSPRYMEGVYELLRYLREADPSVDEIPASMTYCREYLMKLRPDLADVEDSAVEFENWRSWLDQQVLRFGEWIEIPQPDTKSG